MMLPILISVSLAPGSYFFSALAVVTTAATANAVRATEYLIPTGMIFSPLMFYFDQVSQVTRALASVGLFRPTKQHCWAPPSVIDAGSRHHVRSLRGPPGWNRTSELLRDIQNSAPPDSALRDGWRRERWERRAFISSVHPMPMRG